MGHTATTKKVLVTGGAGYIGSAVVKELIAQGCEVTIYDDLSTGREDKIAQGAHFVEGDVNDFPRLTSVFQTQAFDAVVHCAAKKVMNESEENPTKYFRTNVGGTLNILQCMEEHTVPQIIFSSTAAVYAPVGESRPVVETDIVEPASVYGRSKLMCEMLIREYARLQKIASYTILRYFNVAGDAGLHYVEPNPQGVFPSLARAIKNDEPFNIFGTDYPTTDGSAVRDYIHLLDLTSAHVRALQANKSGTYNLGTSTGYSVLELVKEFEEITKKTVKIVEKPRRAGDVAVMLADASYAREQLSWQPQHSLKEMVANTAELFEIEHNA